MRVFPFEEPDPCNVSGPINDIKVIKFITNTGVRIIAYRESKKPESGFLRWFSCFLLNRQAIQASTY